MAMQHHIGSFRPTPLKRVLVFMGLSLVIHVVLVAATSVGYLMRDEPAPAGADGAEATVEVEPAPADASAEPAAEPAPTASSELPERSQPKDATEVYMERQGDDDAAAANPDSLELFE